MNDIDALAARLLDLQERRAAIDEQIDEIKAELLANTNPGDVITYGDNPVFVVTQRRTFNVKIAADTLPPEVIAAASVTKVDGTKVKHLSPALWEACCTLSEPYIAPARQR